MKGIFSIKNPHLKSLRSRAILFSATISALVILLSFIAYASFEATHKQASSHLQKRDDLLVKLGAIRLELLDSYKDLNNFLLAPENEDYRNSILVNISKALEVSEQLQQHEWVEKYNKDSTAILLGQTLSSLDSQVKELIETRLNTTNQYPSLAVGSEIMQPNRNMVNNAFALAINEMDAEDFQTENPEIYKLVIEARHLWSQMLSNFRLYMANRVGSFEQKALPIQETAIETMFNVLRTRLLKLQEYAEAGELGFETADAVPILVESTAKWFEGFVEVKSIHQSDEWRQDAKIMKENIAPNINLIVDLLMQLEQIIKTSSEDDVALFSKAAGEQNIILWGIAILGILFTIFVVISLDKLIFKPISMVSDALKAEALGKKSDNVPIIRSRETHDLVDAFSEMRRQVHIRQTELEYRALHDALTSLPNRTLLLDRLEHDIETAKREEHQLSLLVMDLDDFKEINDTLGHIAGDSLLVEVSARLKNTLRKVDTIARFSGDEFAILLPHTDEEQAAIAAQKVLRILQEPFTLEDVVITITTSIGIAVYPAHGLDAHALYRYADIAMYVAKRNKIGFSVYSEEEDEHSVSRLSMLNDLRYAIEQDELSIKYQPVYKMPGTSMHGVEALARWNHPTIGIINPEIFISLAEQAGLINSLTYWVIDNGISQISQWLDLEPGLCISINLSVYSLKDPDLIEKISQSLEKYSYPAEKLTLEITESATMENPLHAIQLLTELRKMGIQLSIDDFGTGFSSMSYLKQLPVSNLKIDKSFVIGMDQDKDNETIVRSTIDLAHNLGLGVVAEGVETDVVLQMLKEYSCDLAQGYYLSEPLTAEELTAKLQA